MGEDEIYFQGSSLMELQAKLQEAQRANQVLLRSREIQAKQVELVQKKMEKLVEKYKNQVEYLQSQLNEKIKEAKLYHYRLKELYRKQGLPEPIGNVGGDFEREDPAEENPPTKISPIRVAAKVRKL